MYLLVNLIGALLWSKVECEASDLELVCPQGWIANDVAEYSCIFHSETGSKLPGSDDCSVCLTCHWSSTPADRFGNVEVCVITGPLVALRMNSMKSVQFFSKADVHQRLNGQLTQEQYCGIVLPIISPKPKNDRVAPKPCYFPEKDLGSTTADLICPQFFLLASYFKRTSNAYESWCINCQSYFMSNDIPVRITMCHARYDLNPVTNSYPEERFQDCKSSQNVPQDDAQIFCGIKLEADHDGQFSSCIICQNEIDQKLLPVSCLFIILNLTK